MRPRAANILCFYIKEDGHARNQEVLSLNKQEICFPNKKEESPRFLLQTQYVYNFGLFTRTRKIITLDGRSHASFLSFWLADHGLPGFLGTNFTGKEYVSCSVYFQGPTNCQLTFFTGRTNSWVGDF